MCWKRANTKKSNMFFDNVEIEKAKNNNVTDGDLIRAYIGNKDNKMYYKTASLKGFNIWAFLFGELYFFYRKLYITSIVFAIINILIVYMFSTPILIIITRLIAGFSFYKVYGTKVEKRINKLKCENLELSSDELLKKCNKQGGKNALAIILFIFLLLALAFNWFNVGVDKVKMVGVYVCDSITSTSDDKIYIEFTNNKDIIYSNYYNSENNYIKGKFNIYKILKDRYLLISYSSEIVEDGINIDKSKFLIDRMILSDDNIKIENKYTCIKKSR